MRVLIACEFSGIVREAFRAEGHDAFSCDLLPSEIPSRYHIQEDIHGIAYYRGFKWDLMIAHPPCDHLAVSGARWFPEKQKDYRQQKSIVFFMELALAPIPMVAVENPIGIMSTVWRKPDQIIQPWMFGHPETKATCLWLRGLPKLQSTYIVSGRTPRVHYEPPGPDRWKNRSRFCSGIARAMAEQWGQSHEVR